MSAVGLLDDAIREHLKLARLRGVDPSEVIRKEREALGPALREERQTPTEHEAHSEEHPTTKAHTLDRGEVLTDQDLSSCLSQDTVELDMRAVLGTESSMHIAHAKPDTPPTVMGAVARATMERSAPGEHTPGDFPEWEFVDERNPDFSRRTHEKEQMLPPPVRSHGGDASRRYLLP